MLRFRIFTVIAMAGVALQMSADSFDSLVDRMVMLNPGLRSEAFAREAERQSLRSTTVLPDPEIEGGYQWGQKDAGNKLDITLQQSMDWPGVYGSLRKEARLNKKAIALSEAIALIEGREQARMMLVDAVYIKKCKAIISRRLSDSDSLITLATKGSKSNEVTILDLERMKLEHLDAVTLSSELASRENQCISEISGFVASPSEARAIYDSATDYPADMLNPLEVYVEASKSAPQLEKSRILTDISRAKYSTGQRRLLPSLSAGYHFSREDGYAFHGFVAGLSIPVFSSRGRRESAMAERLSTEARQEQDEADYYAMLTSIHGQTMELYAQYSSYCDILDGSSTPRLLRMALDGGQISMMEYLTQMAYYNDALMRMYELQYLYQQSLGKLKRYLQPALNQ